MFLAQVSCREPRDEQYLLPDVQRVLQFLLIIVFESYNSAERVFYLGSLPASCGFQSDTGCFFKLVFFF